MKTSPLRGFIGDLGSAFGPRGKSKGNSGGGKENVASKPINKENGAGAASGGTQSVSETHEEVDLKAGISPTRQALKDCSNTLTTPLATAPKTPTSSAYKNKILALQDQIKHLEFLNRQLQLDSNLNAFMKKSIDDLEESEQQQYIEELNSKVETLEEQNKSLEEEKKSILLMCDFRIKQTKSEKTKSIKKLTDELEPAKSAIAEIAKLKEENNELKSQIEQLKANEDKAVIKEEAESSENADADETKEQLESSECTATSLSMLSTEELQNKICEMLKEKENQVMMHQKEIRDIQKQNKKDLRHKELHIRGLKKDKEQLRERLSKYENTGGSTNQQGKTNKKGNADAKDVEKTVETTSGSKVDSEKASS